MVQVRHWTRQEYDRMVEAGVFAPGERAEMIEEEVLAMTPQGSLHVRAVLLIEEALRAEIADYWLLNLLEQRLEASRDPARQPETRYGSGYRDIRSYAPGDWISPQAVPRATVQVADLLP